MKIIEGFKLRSVAGEMVVSGEGVNQISFNKLIALNPTAAYLWRSIEGEEFDANRLSELLIAEYDVTPAQALTDAQALVANWLECGLIEE
ncbi:MAG: PqqD family protein [Rikenellaceae bacterium]